MSYSFIKPRRKDTIDSDSKIILIFFFVTIFIIFSFTAFMLLEKSSMKEEAETMEHESKILMSQSGEFKDEIIRIERLVQKFEIINTNNTLMKDSIKNLFDLVPDQITLTKAVLNKDGLVLYGVTPSKDIYNYLLLAPLKSVFQRNITTFYPLENGWWRFVSVNEGSIDTVKEAQE